MSFFIIILIYFSICSEVYEGFLTLSKTSDRLKEEGKDVIKKFIEKEMVAVTKIQQEAQKYNNIVKAITFAKVLDTEEQGREEAQRKRKFFDDDKYSRLTKKSK